MNVDQSAINQQKALWQSRQVQSYEATITTYEQWSYSSFELRWLIKVEQGRVIEVTCRTVDGQRCPTDSVYMHHDLTIDRVFALLEANTASYSKSIVQFDPYYGYPQHIRFFNYGTKPILELRVVAFDIL